MSLNTLLSGILFGGIGTAAFIYGCKQAAWKPMVIGLLLIGESWVIPDAVTTWVVGVALTAALWFFRD